MPVTKVMRKPKEECEWCHQFYTHVGKPTIHRACSPYCREAIKINECNQKWIERKPRKIDPRLNQRIEMARLYPSMVNAALKKFHACRGGRGG